MTVPYDGCGHVVAVIELASELLQRFPCDRRALPHHEPDELYAAVGELGDVRGSRALQEPERLPSTLALGVDHEVDAELLPPEDGAARVVLRVGDAGDGVLHPEPARCEARDEVHLVSARHGEQDGCALDARPLQHGERSSVADNGEDVQLLRCELGALWVTLDDRDVVVFLGEAFGEVEAHFTGAHDEDFHLHPERRSRFGSARPAWKLEEHAGG